MGCSVVIMGVSGCGKSSLAAAVSAAVQRPLVEGDDHHSESSRAKMRAGMPLNDTDRDEWLQVLAGILADHPAGIVLTCSALRRAYRERLRRASPNLRFVFMDLQPDEALRRVAVRAGGHFFPPELVASQFETLESPLGEDGVMRADATVPLDLLSAEVARWLTTPA